jgi:hypothetical protein
VKFGANRGLNRVPVRDTVLAKVRADPHMGESWCPVTRRRGGNRTSNLGSQPKRQVIDAQEVDEGLLDWESGMNTAVRALVSALTTVALIIALATTPCGVACGTQARVSSGPPPCCNPDGLCKGSASSTRPCLNSHTLTPGVVEQTVHMAASAEHVDFETVQLVVSQHQQAELPAAAQYSPPYLYLLHSSFLI